MCFFLALLFFLKSEHNVFICFLVALSITRMRKIIDGDFKNLLIHKLPVFGPVCPC